MTTKLLAVDDSKTMRRVLEITFSGDEFQTTIASSSEQALAAVKANPPGVAVVDAHLAGESGYELCRAIKAAAPGTRVLILSSKQRPYDEAQGKSAGADGYFDKPFDSTKMIARVSEEASQASPAAGAATPAFAAPAPGPAAAPAPRSAPAVESTGRRPVAPLPRTSGAPPRASVSGGAPLAAPKPAARSVAQAPRTSAALPVDLESKLHGLGLTAEQVQSVLALSKEVVEQVVWEVVPALAETMIKEEIARLTAE